MSCSETEDHEPDGCDLQPLFDVRSVVRQCGTTCNRQSWLTEDDDLQSVDADHADVSQAGADDHVSADWNFQSANHPAHDNIRCHSRIHRENKDVVSDVASSQAVKHVSRAYLSGELCGLSAEEGGCKTQNQLSTDDGDLRSGGNNDTAVMVDDMLIFIVPEEGGDWNEADVEDVVECGDRDENECEVEGQDIIEFDDGAAKEVASDAEVEDQNEPERDVQTESEGGNECGDEGEALSVPGDEDMNEPEEEVQNVSEDEIMNEANVEALNGAENDALEDSEEKAQNQPEHEIVNEPEEEIQNVLEEEFLNEPEEVQNVPGEEIQNVYEDESMNEAEDEVLYVPLDGVQNDAGDKVSGEDGDVFQNEAEHEDINETDGEIPEMIGEALNDARGEDGLNAEIQSDNKLDKSNCEFKGEFEREARAEDNFERTNVMDEEREYERKTAEFLDESEIRATSGHSENLEASRVNLDSTELVDNSSEIGGHKRLQDGLIEMQNDEVSDGRNLETLENSKKITEPGGQDTHCEKMSSNANRRGEFVSEGVEEVELIREDNVLVKSNDYEKEVRDMIEVPKCRGYELIETESDETGVYKGDDKKYEVHSREQDCDMPQAPPSEKEERVRSRSGTNRDDGEKDTAKTDSNPMNNGLNGMNLEKQEVSWCMAAGEAADVDMPSEWSPHNFGSKENDCAIIRTNVDHSSLDSSLLTARSSLSSQDSNDLSDVCVSSLPNRLLCELVQHRSDCCAVRESDQSVICDTVSRTSSPCLNDKVCSDVDETKNTTMSRCVRQETDDNDSGDFIGFDEIEILEAHIRCLSRFLACPVENLDETLPTHPFVHSNLGWKLHSIECSLRRPPVINPSISTSKPAVATKTTVSSVCTSETPLGVSRSVCEPTATNCVSLADTDPASVSSAGPARFVLQGGTVRPVLLPGASLAATPSGTPYAMVPISTACAVVPSSTVLSMVPGSTPRSMVPGGSPRAMVPNSVPSAMVPGSAADVATTRRSSPLPKGQMVSDKAVFLAALGLVCRSQLPSPVSELTLGQRLRKRKVAAAGSATSTPVVPPKSATHGETSVLNGERPVKRLRSSRLSIIRSERRLEERAAPKLNKLSSVVASVPNQSAVFLLPQSPTVLQSHSPLLLAHKHDGRLQTSPVPASYIIHPHHISTAANPLHNKCFPQSLVLQAQQNSSQLVASNVGASQSQVVQLPLTSPLPGNQQLQLLMPAAGSTQAKLLLPLHQVAAGATPIVNGAILPVDHKASGTNMVGLVDVRTSNQQLVGSGDARVAGQNMVGLVNSRISGPQAARTGSGGDWLNHSMANTNQSIPTLMPIKLASGDSASAASQYAMLPLGKLRSSSGTVPPVGRTCPATRRSLPTLVRNDARTKPSRRTGLNCPRQRSRQHFTQRPIAASPALTHCSQLVIKGNPSDRPIVRQTVVVPIVPRLT